MAIQLKLLQLLEKVPLASWKQRIVDIAVAVGLTTENWSEGGFTRLLVALFAQFHTGSGDVVRIIAASHFLDFAEGLWLTLLAKQVFNVDRIEATYASAVEGITLTNTGGGLFIFDPRDIVFAHANGKTYRNTIAGTLVPGGTLKLDIEAEEPGAASNATPESITELVTTFIGVTCTNTVALVGLDEEKDPELRQRCRDSVAALSIGGIKRAYVFYAKSAKRANGTPVGVTRVRVMPAIGDGTGIVYIAGASGAISAPDVAVVQAIFDESVVPYGFTATVVSATNKSIDPPSTVWVPAALGLSEGAVQDKVAAALEAFVETLPIGGVIISPATGRVYWRALLGVASNAIAGTLKAQMTSEADITVADGEVPVWGGNAADVTVNQVAG
jgi:uncharacterized phage protein gp47/JayE